MGNLEAESRLYRKYLVKRFGRDLLGFEFVAAISQHDGWIYKLYCRKGPGARVHSIEYQMPQNRRCQKWDGIGAPLTSKGHHPSAWDDYVMVLYPATAHIHRLGYDLAAIAMPVVPNTAPVQATLDYLAELAGTNVTEVRCHG